MQPSNIAMLHQQHLAVRALRPLLRCFFATRAQLQRPMPHSKAAIQQRKPQLTTTWGSHNGLTQPHIGAKYLRHAERIAWELGVVDDIRQFDEAAAAYPNPPKLIAATCVYFYLWGGHVGVVSALAWCSYVCACTHSPLSSPSTLTFLFTAPALLM